MNEIRKCISCGNDYIAKRPRQKYCDFCAEEGKEAQCSHCKKLLIINVKRTKAVCEECKEFRCKECGKVFQRSRNEKYCPNCQKKGVKTTCSNCGKIFRVKPKEIHKLIRCDECRKGICIDCGKPFIKSVPKAVRCEECKEWLRNDDFTYSHKIVNGKSITTVQKKDKAEGNKKRYPTMAEIIRFQRENKIASYGLAVIEWDKLHAV